MIQDVAKIDGIDSFIGKIKMKETFKYVPSGQVITRDLNVIINDDNQKINSHGP
jgi:hypothetical protein